MTLTNRKAGTYGITGGLGIGTYEGLDFSAAAHELYFATAKKAFGPKSTLFVVQNAGLVQTSVTATFWCGSPADDYPVQTAALWPGQMAVVEMPDGLATGKLCMLHMAADQEAGRIAGVGAEYYTAERDGSTVASLLQVERGFTADEAYLAFYVPVFKNKFPKPTANYPANRSTGLTVANVNDATTGVYVEVVYVSGGGCQAGDSIDNFVEIPAHEVAVFLHPTKKDGWSDDMPENCWGTARVTVPTEDQYGNPVDWGPVVVMASESFLDPVADPRVQSSAWFNGVPGNRISPVVLIPLFKERYGDRTSGLTIQNTSGSATQCHIEFFAGSGAVYTTTWQSIPAWSAFAYSLVSIQAPLLCALAVTCSRS